MNTAIVLAAGKGSRMKAGINKQYLNLKGRPILSHTLEVFFACPAIDEVVVVIGENDIELCDKMVLKNFNYDKPFKTVIGGQERQGSVQNGLKHVDDNAEIIIIHDGARPFITSQIIETCIEGARKYAAVSLGVPIKETVKVVDDEGFVKNTPNRASIWITQTPQAFRHGIIRQAHELALINKINATDDAMLVEHLGYPVRMIKGDYRNIKITTYEDLVIAEALIDAKKLGDKLEE